MFKILWSLIRIIFPESKNEHEEKTDEEIVSKTGWGFLIKHD